MQNTEGRHRQSALDAEVVTKYCDAIREELEKRDLTKYVNSVLTAYVVKKPADYEASLSLLHRLKGQWGESFCFITLN